MDAIKEPRLIQADRTNLPSRRQETTSGGKRSANVPTRQPLAQTLLRQANVIAKNAIGKRECTNVSGGKPNTYNA